MAMRQLYERIFRYRIEPDTKTAQAMSQLRLQTAQAGNAINAVSNNSRKAALATRNLGYVAQNASYQIADFFVMLQGGVGIGRALSTQLPQLLAGFNVWGAVMGAVAAVGATLYQIINNTVAANIELERAVENLTGTYDDAKNALTAYVETGAAGTEITKELAEEARELAAIDLAKVLSPPDPSVWSGMREAWRISIAAIKESLSLIPGLEYLAEAYSYAAEKLSQLEVFKLPDKFVEGWLALSESANAQETALINLVNQLLAATEGTVGFSKAYRQLRTELNAATGEFTWPPEATAFPEFDDAKARVIELTNTFSFLYGTDPRTWSDEVKAAMQAAKDQFSSTAKSLEGLREDYTALISTQDNGVYSLLKRQTDLEKEISKWERALDEGRISAEGAKAAIEALTEIDRWKPLQDIVLDLGKQFEDSIVGAMKTGKFAVQDFVKFALEELARLYLSKIFTGLFTAFANFLPGLGGVSAGGAPSPGYGGANLGRMLEPPPSVGEMYNYGESISRVPGASRNLVAPQANNVTVNVNNYGNDEVTVKQAETSNGLEIDVIIKNTVRNALGDGSFDRVMASSFGARRLGY